MNCVCGEMPNLSTDKSPIRWYPQRETTLSHESSETYTVPTVRSSSLNMNTRTSRAFNGMITSVIQYAVQSGLQIIMAPLLLRTAGQETLGAYAILAQAIGYMALVDLGFSVSLSLFMAKAYGYEDQGARFRTVITIGRSFHAVTNTLFSLAAIVFALNIGQFFDLSPTVEEQARIALFLMAGWAFIRTLIDVYKSATVAVQEMAFANISLALANLARLAASLILVSLGFGLIGMMVGNIIGEAFNDVRNWLHFRKKHPDWMATSWGIPDFALFREMFSMGMQIFVINGAGRLILHSGNLVAGLLFGTTSAAVYYSTQMPVTIAWLLINQTINQASSAINELFVKKQMAQLRSAFLRLHRFNLLIAFPIAIGIGFLLEALVTLWVGAEQFGGTSLAIALAIFAVQLPFTNVSNQFVIANSKIRLLSLFNLVEGFTNLALALILGGRFGLAGIMWASVLANLITNSYVQWRATHILELSFWELIRGAVLPPAAIGAIGVVALYTIRTLIPPVTWGGFIADGVLFLVVIAPLTWFIGLKAEDRAAILEMSVGRLKLRTAK